MSYSRTPKPAERHGSGISFPAAIAYTGEHIAIDAVGLMRNGRTVVLQTVNVDPRTLATTASSVELDRENGRHLHGLLGRLLDEIEKDDA